MTLPVKAAVAASRNSTFKKARNWTVLALLVFVVIALIYVAARKALASLKKGAAEDRAISDVRGAANVAERLWGAFYPWGYESSFFYDGGTDEDELYRIIREDVPSTEFYEAVAKEYKNLYGRSLNEVLGVELDSKERAVYNRILAQKPLNGLGSPEIQENRYQMVQTSEVAQVVNAATNQLMQHAIPAGIILGYFINQERRINGWVTFEIPPSIPNPILPPGRYKVRSHQVKIY